MFQQISQKEMDYLISIGFLPPSDIKTKAFDRNEEYVVFEMITKRLVESQPTIEKAFKAVDILNEHAKNNNQDVEYCCVGVEYPWLVDSNWSLYQVKQLENGKWQPTWYNGPNKPEFNSKKEAEQHVRDYIIKQRNKESET